MINDILNSGSKELGISLSSKQFKDFTLLFDEINKWGTKINITALLKDKERLVEELFIDSMAPLLYMRGRDLSDTKLLDIGSGGGFPGIPLQIAEPALKVTLSDSIEKKVFFIRHVIRKLGLKTAEAHCVRFGSPYLPSLDLNVFDWATSKAVTNILELSTWALPYLKRGGKLICLKSPMEAPSVLPGYKDKEEYAYYLPFNRISRQLFIYEKI